MYGNPPRYLKKVIAAFYLTILNSDHFYLTILNSDHFYLYSDFASFLRYKLRIANYQLRIARYELAIGKYKLASHNSEITSNNDLFNFLICGRNKQKIARCKLRITRNEIWIARILSLCLKDLKNKIWIARILSLCLKDLKNKIRIASLYL